MTNDTQNTVTVNVANRSYHIRCTEESADQLLASAEYLDAQMLRMKQPGRSSQSESLAVVTALNVTHELLQTRNQAQAEMDQLTLRIQSLENKLQEALETTDEVAV